MLRQMLRGLSLGTLTQNLTQEPLPIPFGLQVSCTTCSEEIPIIRTSLSSSVNIGQGRREGGDSESAE